MVTHSMRHALDCGSRTVMLHEGRICFDVAGEARAGLDVPDLVALFAKVRCQLLDDATFLPATANSETIECDRIGGSVNC